MEKQICAICTEDLVNTVDDLGKDMPCGTLVCGEFPLSPPKAYMASTENQTITETFLYSLIVYA